MPLDLYATDDSDESDWEKSNNNSSDTGARKKKKSSKIHSVSHLSKNTEYQCEICKTEDVKHYTCDVCDKRYFSRRGIVLHQLQHGQPYYTSHNNIPHVCMICNKQFKSSSALKAHSVKHTTIRAFTCDICNKSYKLDTSLRLHKLSHRPDQFHCEYCPRSFTQKSQQQAHMRLHTGVRPYKCQFCLKKFAQKTSLDNHILKHKGVKPYQCEICEKWFRQVSNLKQHVRKNHPDNKVNSSKKTSKVSLAWYSCKKCKAMLTSTFDYRNHLRLCH